MSALRLAIKILLCRFSLQKSRPLAVHEYSVNDRNGDLVGQKAALELRLD